MTVSEATTLLFDWFAENDSFEIEEDFKKVVLVTDSPTRDRAAFLSSLSSLEESGLVKHSKVNGASYWVLSKNFAAYEQTVTISSEAGSQIAKVINSFCEIYNIESERCDPTNLTDRDIQNLIFVCSKVLEEKTPEDSS